MLVQFAKSHLFFTPPEPTKSFTGQTILVTGSNVGLGLEAARWFVRLDAQRVILAVRSLEKGEAAKQSIDSTEKRPGVVEVWKLDLGDYDSIKAFATRADSGLDRVDVLVENAGILAYKFEMMADDESIITTNVVSPVLHSLLMLPKLRETAIKYNTQPRLCFTGSFVHYITPFKEQKEKRIFEALADEKKSNMNDRYNVSKLLETFAVRELADLMTASRKQGKVIVNIVNPGAVKTNVMRDLTGFRQIVGKASEKLVARTTEVGSRTLVNAAEGGEETHGQYLDDCKVGKFAPLVSSENGQKLQKRVWTELAQKLEGIQPGILQNI